MEGGGTDNTIVTSEAFFVDLAGRENEKTTKAAWLAKVLMNAAKTACARYRVGAP